jgi:hypothetical protein
MRKITPFLPFAAIARAACGYSVSDAAGDVKPSGTSA